MVLFGMILTLEVFVERSKSKLALHTSFTSCIQRSFSVNYTLLVFLVIFDKLIYNLSTHVLYYAYHINIDARPSATKSMVEATCLTVYGPKAAKVHLTTKKDTKWLFISAT